MIKDYIACKSCADVKKYDSKYGSSNALKHAKKHEKTETVITNFFVRKDAFTMNMTEKDKITQAAVKLVCKDLNSFATVEGEGMIDFAHTIWNMGAIHGAVGRDDIANALPSAVTVSRNVRKIALQKKEEMTARLQEIFTSNLFLAITTDIWQDDHNRLSYLSVTVHYYSSSGELCDQLITMKPLECGKKKDAPYIKRIIKEALEERGIPFDEKKLIFVTDRGSNIKKALDRFIRLNCFPHFINNTVRESCKIDTIKNVLDACSSLVKYFKISGLNNELETSLKSAVKTRFNSSLTMIESILKNKEMLSVILDRENELHRLQNIDFSIMEELNEFLKPFKHWSEFTERSLKPSLCHVWIAIDSIIQHCSIKPNESHLTTLMKIKAISYIESKFDLHKFHRIATFLNPNYKCLRFASEILYDMTVSDVREMLSEITTPVAVTQNRRLSSSTDSTVESAMSNYCTQFVEMDEVDKYIRLTHLPDLGVDLPAWWSVREKDFPKLSKLAISIHAIPASSASSERAFSLSGAVITEKRTQLKPDAVENILLIHSDSLKFGKRNIWNWLVIHCLLIAT